MDGGIDYSQYSREQLEGALLRIDRSRYPLNLERLTRELESRPPAVQLSQAEMAAIRRVAVSIQRRW